MDDSNLPQEEIWELRLYVAGRSAKSLLAIANLKKICAEHLQDRHNIEIIDLVEHPQIARKEQIIAVPTLIKRFPLPLKQIIGDLSDREKVLRGLDLQEL